MPGIYVHIPFCRAKCGYCDFHSLVAEDNVLGAYLDALKQEIVYYRDNLDFAKPFDSVYIGGGTPSLLSSYQLDSLIGVLVESFPLKAHAELTMEANPKTLDLAKAKAVKGQGINRVSLGVQAFQDRLLRRMGRIHQVADVDDSLEVLRQAGIANISLDLIYALPGQTITDWQASLTAAVKRGISHLSCYSLIIEENTPFFDQQASGLLDLPPEEEEVAMFEITTEYLESQGFSHYEVSNYALTGKESRHNLLYWQNQPYLALGSGAHGYWQDKRYANTKDLHSYISSWQRGIPTLEFAEKIALEQQMDETMMVGLRLLAGVSEDDFRQRFGRSFFSEYPKEISQLRDRGLLEFVAGRLRLTKQGLFLGNLVFSAFVRDRISPR